MNDIISLLSFMWIPIAISILFSMVLPICGTVMAARNELLIPLSLPAAATTLYTAIAISQLSIPETTMVIITATALTAIYRLVSINLKSHLKREMSLAVILIGSQSISRSLIAFNPLLNGEFEHLLNGEIAAVGLRDLQLGAVLTSLALTLFFLFFPILRSFTLDENTLRGTSKFQYATLLFLLTATMLITFSSVTIGPLLTTSLLVIPPLFSDTGRSNFSSTLKNAILISITALFWGFPLALFIDHPPAYTCSLAVLITSVIFKMLPSVIGGLKR